MNRRKGGLSVPVPPSAHCFCHTRFFPYTAPRLLRHACCRERRKRSESSLPGSTVKGSRAEGWEARNPLTWGARWADCNARGFALLMIVTVQRLHSFRKHPLFADQSRGFKDQFIGLLYFFWISPSPISLFLSFCYCTMILPLAKLGTLALRTMCKPIASRLKKEAGNHPRFRNLIINIAQWNHRFSTNMQRRLYGHATNVEIRPLNEEKAVQASADLLGELFVFSVAGAVVVFEVQRSSRSEARKEESRKAELVAMKQKQDDLSRELELLQQKIHELEQLSRGRGLPGILKFGHAQPTERLPPAASAAS